MGRIEQGFARRFFDGEIGPGRFPVTEAAEKAAFDKHVKSDDLIGSRGILYVRADLGTLRSLRLFIRLLPNDKGEIRGGSVFKPTGGFDWRYYVFPNGKPYWDVPDSGGYAIPFDVQGSQIATFGWAAEGDDKARGKLALHTGTQSGGI